MDSEQFDAVSQAISCAGAPAFIPALMELVSGVVQVDHLAVDVLSADAAQKTSLGASVTSSVFATALAVAAGPVRKAAAGGSRPGTRRTAVHRLDLQALGAHARGLDFYRRFGVIDGVEIQWRDGQALLHLDLYRTHRLGVLSKQEEARLAAGAEMFATLVELHLSLSRLDFAATAGRTDGVLEALVGQLGRGLTPRENAVACRIAAGMGTAEIARDMGVAPATIVTFRKRAYAKLGIRSRAELFGRCMNLLSAAQQRDAALPAAAAPAGAFRPRLVGAAGH